MKVVVLGAGGIVGQHMLVTAPDPHKALFCRRQAGALWAGVDLEDWQETERFLEREAPDVIVNLAGENRVDVVERDSERSRFVNVVSAGLLGMWCDEHCAHLIQVSTQGIFDGEDPPYGAASCPSPITEYGKQKAAAESSLAWCQNWTIARLTFVLGARPFAGVGRPNPLEEMFAAGEQVQVNDRWFSPLFATDAAAELWRLVDERPVHAVVHLGTPIRVSRYDVATRIPYAIYSHPGDSRVHAVSHSYFEGIAPRPIDTTWDQGARWRSGLEEGLLDAWVYWRRRERMDVHHRSRELALFFDMPYAEAFAKLDSGFGSLHQAVAIDFNRAAPRDDAELLDWYRTTTAYIWELSAYHLDPGFNYMGMCEGIAVHLGGARAQGKRVLCLGDGIGDLSLTLGRHGIAAAYHDLAASRTAAFAQFRFELNGGVAETRLTTGWDPTFGGEYDAIVALDFFEHLVNVEDWARASAAALRPGGQFLAQNAFAIGDPDHGGSIPMHLSRNNRFEQDWDPLLESVGLSRAEGGWWRK